VPREIDSKSALTAYVKDRLAREERAAGRGYRKRVSDLTGLSHAHVSNLMNRSEIGVGMNAVDGFVRLRGLRDASELVALATEWAREQGPVLATASTEPPRQKAPHLEDAIHIDVERHGPLPQEALDELHAIARIGRDFPVSTWRQLIADLRDLLGREQKTGPDAGTVGPVAPSKHTKKR